MSSEFLADFPATRRKPVEPGGQDDLSPTKLDASDQAGPGGTRRNLAEPGGNSSRANSTAMKH
eukprot:7312332-Alexandrium_andersonii.AAC.1